MSTPKPSKTGTPAKSGPEIQLFPLDRSPGRMIYRAHMAMRWGLLRILRNSGFDLSVEEWVILSSLWEFGEITQSELGDRVAKDRHFVSRLLNSLESRHLIQRKGARNDRRINRVKLTAEGKEARTVLLTALDRFFSEVFGGVSQTQYEAFIECLDAIVAWHADQQPKEAEGSLPILPLSDPSGGSCKWCGKVGPAARAVRRTRT